MILRELSKALHSLLTSAGYTGTAALTLAMEIGASTAISGVINGVNPIVALREE